MTIQELNDRLCQQEIITLKADEWAKLTVHFEELERHYTFVLEDLLILQGDVGLVAVDQPSNSTRIIRWLPSVEEKDRFVKDRLDAYERMWDGCGCKINYHK
jgi:hypothetical protein